MQDPTGACWRQGPLAPNPDRRLTVEPFSVAESHQRRWPDKAVVLVVLPPRRSRVRLLTPYRRHAWWPVGQNERVAGDNIDSVTLSDADRVSLWLMSTDGRNAVQRTLRALRLPGFFDTDLVVMVCHAADRMVAKGEPIESIPAWTTRTLRLRGIDLFRSPRSSSVSTTMATHDGVVDRDIADSEDALAHANAEFDASSVRQRLGAAWFTEDPWAVSAALSVLTVLYDEGSPGAGCPQPVGGASDIESAHWVGLWYAGRRDVFPTASEPAGNTLTKRRSRATAAVKELLRARALDDMGGEYVG